MAAGWRVTSTAVRRCARLGVAACSDGASEPLVIAKPTPNTIRPCDGACHTLAAADPKGEAAVGGRVDIAVAAGRPGSPPAGSRAVQRQEQQHIGDGADARRRRRTGPPGPETSAAHRRHGSAELGARSRRAGCRRSPSFEPAARCPPGRPWRWRRCRPGSGSSTQSTGTSWMRRPAAFGEHQQLGVEEPSGVLDVGQQLWATSALMALNPHWASLNRAASVESRRGCSIGRSPRAWVRALRATRGPAGCRSRRPNARDTAGPSAGAGQRGRWTGRRPCRPVPAHRRQPTPRRSALPRPFCSIRTTRHRAVRRRAVAAIIAVASVLALSAIVMRNENGKFFAQVAMQPVDRVGQDGLLVVDRNDDVEHRDTALSGDQCGVAHAHRRVGR